ncbi:NAD-dependent epimerase/dehydratase family protein [Lichenifustis flavocetrariae]|uniref:NAD-dependent epimerase/dehydratase family protein n=1 Tax=Lichenifustis flavocetrariae TaxID=2949735 RepID=A0AA41YY97_9HYPH|nr:NAD-dependent epimerase/dehydratase family protein [Lichenifustis flavocetrariae]MCW6509525.1 NAD-dependent epimerase/dehydratase family protein [Lichenifustis flavocetrariae]
MHVLITGTAGFIGFHVAARLLGDGHSVDGVDGMTPYYDTSLKEARHAVLQRFAAFQPHILMLDDMARLEDLAARRQPDVIIHLAAQAGVRHSLEQPRAYLESNLAGTFNILELARQVAPRHLLLASTSSIYGASGAVPSRETDRTDHPLSLYAATKKGAEDMAHSYAHLWRIPITAFRFFTVYGPWGRPDMAYFKFVRAALAGQAIEVFGHGRMQRDFTYVDDLVEAVVRLIGCPPVQGAPIGTMDSLSPVAPYRAVNIAGGQSVPLLDYIDAIERSVGVAITRTMVPMQKGDVEATTASPALLKALTGFVPTTPVSRGVQAFVDWYRGFYPAT